MSTKTSFLEREYHHLSLWYFVSFIFGIVCFFESDFNISFYILFCSLCSLGIMVCYFYSKLTSHFHEILCTRWSFLSKIISCKNLSVFFITACILAFVSGFTVAQMRISGIQTQPISKIISSELEGKVDQIKPSARGMQITLQNVKLTNYRDLSKIRINIASKLISNVNYGDVIRLRAKLFPLQSGVLPGTYDFGFYMYMSGVEASGYALTNLEVIEKNTSFVNQIIQNIRRSIYNRLIEVLGAEEGNFAAAILIGETKAIPRQVAEGMRNSGVAHILSVSGLHLSLVAMIFFVTSRMVLNCSNYLAYRVNIKTIAAFISIIGSFFYLQISGNNIAATRAFIMTSIFIISIILGRSPYPLRSVMIAAFTILVFLPEYVLHPSFQLSFAAVLCLISGYEFFLRHKYMLGGVRGVFGSIKIYILTNIYSSFLASIITAPFVVYHFYKFANYSVIMNLIAVPLMSFFMMPLALLSVIMMPFSLDGMILKTLGWCINIIIKSAVYITDLPGSLWVTGYISSVSLLIFAFGFFWVCLWQSRVRFIGIAIMLFSLCVMFMGKKPDFIYDHNLKAVGVVNEAKELEIYAQEEPPVFISDYWASWYGQKSIDIIEAKIAAIDESFVLPSGKMISLNYRRCTDSDVQFITSKKLKCPNARQIISNKELQKYKQVLLYCNNNNLCKIEFKSPGKWQR